MDKSPALTYRFSENRQFGRAPIFAPVDEVTIQNIREILAQSEKVFEDNRKAIRYWREYWKGRQPILERTKEVRPTINHRWVVNHAWELVEFKNGRLFSSPVQYVRSGDNEGSDEELRKLNRMMTLAGKSRQDYELGEWFHVTGTAYRIVMPDRDRPHGFFIDVIPADECYVVYSSRPGRKPLMSVQHIAQPDNRVLLLCHTPRFVFQKYLDDEVITRSQNPIGAIPVVEYPLNSVRLSDLEVVEDLMNAMNNNTSDRANAIAQFVESFLKLMNCDIDDADLELLREGYGVIKVKTVTPGMPADVSMVSNEMDQEGSQVYADDLYAQFLTISGMPNREGNTGGDTGEAVSKRNGWEAAEERARKTESFFIDSERRFLDVLLRILRIKGLLDIAPEDIDVKLSRQKNQNLLVKTQGLLNQLEAGVHPQIAMETIDLYPDAGDAWARSDAGGYLKKWLTDLTADQAEPKLPPDNPDPQKVSVPDGSEAL